MGIEDAWANTEECLLREADSLGELLELLRRRISPALIGGREWEGVVQRARGMPVTMAAFPFGFELPLHESRPHADLGVSIIGGSRTAAFFEEGREAGATAAGVARLLAEMEPEESPLRRVAGRKMLLECDVDSTPGATQPDAGIFLYPPEDVLVGGGSSPALEDLGVVADAVAAATGWEMDAAERLRIRDLYLAMEPGACIRAVGSFPSRKRGLRLAMTGFRKTGDVMRFLERAGWPGDHSTVAATVSFFEERRAFVYLGIHFDVDANGVGPVLGVSFYAGEGQWLKDVRHWTPLLDAIGEARLAEPEKLSEIASSSSGAEALFGRSNPFMHVRGIHHIKLGVTADRVEQVKAYVFNLMLALPARANPPARD